MTAPAHRPPRTPLSIGGITVSCLAVAVAAWLLPASVHLVNWGSGGPERIALLAPLIPLSFLLAAGGIVTAALVLVGAPTRDSLAERSRRVAPLGLLWLWTLPYWPWLPDRAPLLLILAGPGRWLVAGTALTGVLIAFVKRRAFLPAIWPIGRKTVFGLTLVLYVALGLRSLATIGLGGDEPHYLIITHSLLADGDLKIENNHTGRDYRAFFRGELRPDFMKRGQDGAIYSIHSPGLPVLLLPGYALDGARGAMVTMCLFGALAALAVYEVALLVGGAAAAWLTWIGVCLTVPFVPHGWMVYPETAGAAIVAWAIVWLVRPLPERAWTWLARGACLAALPWLHTKFVVFLGMLALFLFWRLRSHLKHLVAFAAPLVVSSLAWFGFFYLIYASFDPQAPYGGYTEQFVRFVNIPRSLLGLLFDQKFGLLVYSPLYLAALAGLWFLWRDRACRGLALALGATLAPYVISSTRLYMWWGGSSAPARFLVPVLPLLAPALAAAFARVRGRVAQATLSVWLILGVLIAAAGVTQPERALLFSTPHGFARLLEVVEGSAPMAASLPTFTEENWIEPLGRAAPWTLAAAAALGLAALVATRLQQVTTFWIASIEAAGFVMLGAVLSTPSGTSVRAESTLRGRIELMVRYDPERLRGFDYSAMARLDPAGLLRTSTWTVQRPPDGPIDERGRVAGPIGLPPGRYETRVWFGSQLQQSGELQLLLRRGNVLARAAGPLDNPATMIFDMPARIPFWVSLSEPSSAAAVQRVDIAPISIVPRGRRLDVQARAVEAIEGGADKYIVYINDDTYPEGGVFWTRAGNRGEVLVAPSGSAQMTLTLHVGPNAGIVKITAAGQSLDTEVRSNETRTLTVALSPNAALVPVSIQASGWFRPSEVEPGSTDTRALGCQVRISLQ